MGGDLDLYSKMKSTRRTLQSLVSNLPTTISSGKMFHEDLWRTVTVLQIDIPLLVKAEASADFRVS